MGWKRFMLAAEKRIMGKGMQEKYLLLRLLMLSMFIFFSVLCILSLLGNMPDKATDRAYLTLISFLALLLHRRMGLSAPVILFGMVPVLLHFSGLFGNVYFGIPFDHYLHFLAGVSLGLIFAQYLFNIEAGYVKKSRIRIFLLSVFIVMGIGSAMEITEFIGYSYMGEGSGILFYGTGDIGEWNNAAWDMICNTLGAALGSAIMVFSKRNGLCKPDSRKQ